jgi:hypothetical protein
MTFKILKEELVYKRYLQVWNRSVQYPDGRIFDWDVVGQNNCGPHFCVVFPYDTKQKTVRVLQEYSQGPNELKYTLIAGGFDPKKHSCMLDCVRDELSEEAHLKGGNVICLLQEKDRGISELKWGCNHFLPYICIDPDYDVIPKERDPEGLRYLLELIMFEDITISEFYQLILHGKLMLPSVQTGIMALEWLKVNDL